MSFLSSFEPPCYGTYVCPHCGVHSHPEWKQVIKKLYQNKRIEAIRDIYDPENTVGANNFVEALNLPDTLKPMADALRLVGNSAVHRVSEIDFSQSNEEAHEIADLLSEFLNQIVDSFLARPGKATELIQRVLARKKKR
ncbi:DUF4145 domain-containing protein [Sutterella wadsworthensis]|jgi:hypothetical protein|uniref:DUF4145 domain-containing protein n=1 Tax=Sutterella wadsworthensis TaxID=40545 RepID=UPI001C027066|nr:DUF4145 domain-containing protein [Sutterella wadsworthensis]MBT9622313.1 DUF4145 domain-containing protein [Sutterella wadsworthensis]